MGGGGDGREGPSLVGAFPWHVLGAPVRWLTSADLPRRPVLPLRGPDRDDCSSAPAREPRAPSNGVPGRPPHAVWHRRRPACSMAGSRSSRAGNRVALHTFHAHVHARRAGSHDGLRRENLGAPTSTAPTRTAASNNETLWTRRTAGRSRCHTAKRGRARDAVGRGPWLARRRPSTLVSVWAAQRQDRPSRDAVRSAPPNRGAEHVPWEGPDERGTLRPSPPPPTISPAPRSPTTQQEAISRSEAEASAALPPK